MRARGRPKKKMEDRVLANGLFPKQWKWLQKEAKIRGFAETTPFLRAIVDDFMASVEAERASLSKEEQQESDKDFESMIEALKPSKEKKE